MAHVLDREADRPTPAVRAERQPGRATGYVALGLATFLMGSWVVAGKLAVASLPVALTSWLRLAIAAVVLVTATLWTERGLPRVGLRDCRWPFCEALSGVVLGSVFMLAGVQFTSAGDAGIILATTPAAAAALAVWLLRERLGAAGWSGIALAVAGIAILTVVNGSAEQHAPRRALGNLLVCGAVGAEAVSVLVGKRAADSLPPLRVATLVMVLALLLLAPFAAVQARSVNFVEVPRDAWLAILYYGLGGSVSSTLWFAGLRRVPASAAAVFMGVPPVSAVLLSYLLLHEPVSWSHGIGIACVLVALTVVHRAR